MTVDTRETSGQAAPSIRGRLADAARHAAHLSHEARMVKSLAEDAIEDGVHTARRAVKSVHRGIERAQDIKDEAASYVKRRPLTTTVAVGLLGVIVGFTAGWIVTRGRPGRTEAEVS